MDGWLISIPASPDEQASPDAEGEPRFFAAWIADEAAAVQAVRTEAGADEVRAVEPLGEPALRTYGATPGGVTAVPTPSG